MFCTAAIVIILVPADWEHFFRGVQQAYVAGHALSLPPFRGDAQRALPQEASPMVDEFHTPVYMRPLRLTHGTLGSRNQNASITKLFKKLAKVRDTPVHAVLSSAKGS
eukprot:712500-Pelagomonas_calceolata.AAC.3